MRNPRRAPLAGIAMVMTSATSTKTTSAGRFQRLEFIAFSASLSRLRWSHAYEPTEPSSLLRLPATRR